MHSQTPYLPQKQQTVVDRFVAACHGDERVVAAMLGGSYATGTADAYSDLDLRLITSDAAFEDFLAGHEAFIRLVGDPQFLERFDCPHAVFFIFADGTECELAIGREGRFGHIQHGPYRVLLDKADILAGAVFPPHAVDPAEQRETLRRLIYWFWHDLSHLTAALARGRRWWAQGQIEILRRVCVNLARLSHDFSAAADSYDKVEEALPVELLAPLAPTVCAGSEVALFDTALIILTYYRQMAQPLARTHGIPYPERLDQVMSRRFESVRPVGPA